MKTDKADRVRQSLQKIADLPPRLGDVGLETFHHQDWRRTCMKMAEIARAALYDLDRSDADKPGK